MFTTSRSSSSGFTFIELLVVMAIIGILVTMVAGSYQTSRLKANDARRKSDLSQIQKSLELYMNDQGKYPASDPDGKIMGCGAGATESCNWGSEFKNTSTGTIYMIKLPTDVLSPTYQYRYVASSNQLKYQIFAHLQNDKDPSNVTTLTYLCGTTGSTCTYGVSSTNATILENLGQ